MGEIMIFVGFLVVIILLGGQFIRGKWLGLIGGNTDSYDSKEARRVGKSVGIALILVAVVLVLYRIRLFPTWLMYSVVVILVLTTLVLINKTSKKE